VTLPSPAALVRTLLGAAVGAAGGAAYAHFVGCHSGTCLITSNVWIAAAFFGFTGAVVASPGAERPPVARPQPGAERSAR
jgi:Family of unknown function (DUF6132)